MAILPTAWFALAGPATRAILAQSPRINIHRYVLGVDVPESPALTALGVTHSAVQLGSAPKPLTASLVAMAGPSGETVTGAGLDIAPYYLLAGPRDLASYRSNSIAGRLTRVLTKTLLSLAVVRHPADLGDLRLGLAARSTIHDPHDPILNTRLVEETHATGGAGGAALPDAGVESLTDLGVNLAPEFAAGRRAARSRSGDAQISVGLGVGSLSRDGALGEFLDGAHFAGWIAAQYTADAKLDLLATVHRREMFGLLADRWWLGGGLRRKADRADVQGSLYYDTATRELHPSLAFDIRLAARLGGLAALGTIPDPENDAPRVRLTLLLRWFAAADPLGP
jgi:hypothetical protein